MFVVSVLDRRCRFEFYRVFVAAFALLLFSAVIPLYGLDGVDGVAWFWWVARAFHAQAFAGIVFVACLIARHPSDTEA